MKKLLLLLAALAFLSLPAAALADTITYVPNPANLNDLDHHLVYTWRLDGVNLGGQTITSVKLTFTNIRNWDTNPNVLHLHLLDTAKSAGVAAFIDDPTGAAPVTDFTDDFISARYHGNSAWLVAAGTADTFLVDKSFTTTGVNYQYDFTQAQINDLAAYIANGGNFAIGFDPDCHYFNSGISLVITTTPAAVPEPTTMALLGTGLLSTGFYLRRRRRTKG